MNPKQSSKKLDNLKLTVENLANIEKADIEIKPLTIFFGENNTNKSFMAHVIYGVYKYLYDLSMKIAFDLYLNKIEKSKAIRELEKSLLDSILELFRSKKMEKRRNELSIRIIEPSLDQIIEGITEEIREIMEEKKIREIFEFAEEIVLKTLTKVSPKYYQVYYFPASRTGFMLAFEALISGIIKERYGKYEPYEHLTEPVVDFLYELHNLKSSKPSNRKKYIEILSDIISGEIWIEEGTKRVYYHPKEKGQRKIEMHLSSSSVVEIAPLYIFIERADDIENTFLVIEEPESHLHPINQIKMAEFIVALVNSGAKVLITTHSDYILSGINLCIKRFWVGETENINKYVSPEKISAYIFRRKGKREVFVEPLTIKEPEGIPYDNFYEVSEKIIQEEELLEIEIQRRSFLGKG